MVFRSEEDGHEIDIETPHRHPSASHEELHMSEATPEDEDKRKRKRGLIGRLWRGWVWYNRAHSGYGWLGWLLGGKIGAAVGVVALAGLAGVTGMAFLEPDALKPFLINKPRVEVATKTWDQSVVFPIEGRDKAGRKAAFDVVISYQDTLWVRGSADHLERNGVQLADADITGQVLGPQVRQGLSPSADVIAVGVASQEGGAASEESRAEKRGRTAAQWVSTVLSPQTRVWVLNLGQFRVSCTPDKTASTGWQRPFMLIGVRSQDPGVNIGEALADAMSGKSNLPSTECYSLFAMGKVRG